MTSREEIERLKAGVSIETILGALGFRTEHRGYMYYSPLRDESTPSMSVRFREGIWQWFDHGEGVGGSNLDLVRRIRGCGFREAVETLASLSSLPVVSENRTASHDRGQKRSSQEGAITVQNVSDRFTRFRLISYLESRGIPLDLAQRFCREVTYRNSNTGRTYTAVGFPNDRGGWVLRSDVFKGTTASGITTMNTKGRTASEPSSDRVMVFEGFFNLLSWMRLAGRETLPCDAVVLNSVTNASKAVDYIGRHSVAEAWLDNDRTGRECLDRLRAMCPGTAFRDRSGMYEGFNDLNELLKGRLDKEAGEKTSAIYHNHKP